VKSILFETVEATVLAIDKNKCILVTSFIGMENGEEEECCRTS
jgi:hypothetical protein